jgi:hypothetical protein
LRRVIGNSHASLGYAPFARGLINLIVNDRARVLFCALGGKQIVGAKHAYSRHFKATYRLQMGLRRPDFDPLGIAKIS